MVLGVPCANRGVALRHADKGESAREFDERKAAILENLHGDVDHVPRRGDAPGAVLPE